jgi:hypothetical protein
MTRSFRRVYTGNLKEIYGHATSTCDTNIKVAFNEALESAEKFSKTVAPVYDPEQWLAWWGYEHHYIPPGTLKASIYHTPLVSRGRSTMYTARFGASANFASYIEEGFPHRKAKKFIAGKRFMRTSLNFVFKPALDRNLSVAVRRMFQVI